jgi:hypothetical protein
VGGAAACAMLNRLTNAPAFLSGIRFGDSYAYQSLIKSVFCQPNRVKGRFASALDPLGLAHIWRRQRAVCLGQSRVKTERSEVALDGPRQTSPQLTSTLGQAKPAPKGVHDLSRCMHYSGPIPLSLFEKARDRRVHLQEYPTRGAHCYARNAVSSTFKGDSCY